MRISFRTAYWWLMDWIFPLAELLSPEKKQANEEREAEEKAKWESRTAALPADEESLKQYLGICKTALDEERQRQDSVNTRLTTIIGFSSIAATIAFGTLLTGIPQKPGALTKIILLLLGYLTLQLGSAIRAGISGLDRRPYDRFPLPDQLPTGNESQAYYVRRQIEQYHAVFVQHQEQNNAKLTQMAVAYRAIKNFVAGLLLFAVLAGANRLMAPPSDELLDRLKSDYNLREMLRGPQGQPGPAGARGATGPMGPPCTVPPVAPPPTGVPPGKSK